MSDVSSVTIIIVNYRCEQWASALLESIARQGEGWVDRVVVVDNASADGSVEALQAKVAALGVSGWVQVVNAKRNAGFGAGNNIGASIAQWGEKEVGVLWFLNPDTLVDGTELGPALEQFGSDEGVGIVGTGLDSGKGERDVGAHREITPISEFIRSAGAFRVLRRWSVSDSALDRTGRVDWVSGASLMIRTSTFEELGGFDERFFLYFEEVDLCRRARKAGWAVVYEPRVRVVHFEGQTTGVRRHEPRPWYWYESRQWYFVKHRGVVGLAAADACWAAGKLVGWIRGRESDGCSWSDVWRCDAPVVLGRKRVQMQNVL